MTWIRSKMSNIPLRTGVPTRIEILLDPKYYRDEKVRRMYQGVKTTPVGMVEKRDEKQPSVQVFTQGWRYLQLLSISDSRGTQQDVLEL